MIVLLATLLLAQAQPGHQRQGVPVRETNRSAASEHGATLGHQEVAPGAERKGEHEKSGEEHDREDGDRDEEPLVGGETGGLGVVEEVVDDVLGSQERRHTALRAPDVDRSTISSSTPR